MGKMIISDFADQRLQVRFLTQWIEALRSGTYQQGKDFLRIKMRNGEQWCALGVGCDVAAKLGYGEWIECLENDRHHWKYRFGTDSSMCQPPCYLFEVFGLTFSPELTYNGEQRSVTELSDDGILTFAELATLIEDQFLRKALAVYEKKPVKSAGTRRKAHATTTKGKSRRGAGAAA